MKEGTGGQKITKVKGFQPTPRQRKLAKLVSENIRTDIQTKSSGALLLQAGYSREVADKPSMILRGAGFLKAMAELGLTQELITSSLVQDIEAKPGRRAFELSIAAKILGMDKRVVEDAPTVSATNSIIIINPPNNGSVEPQLKDTQGQ